MPYIQVEIISGDVYECTQAFSTRFGKKDARKKKAIKSSEKQKVLNEKNARLKVSRLINANFGKNDLFITLTYAGAEPTLEQAKKDLVNFMRRVKHYRKRNVLSDVKYIAVTENEEKRVHHHIIMTSMSMDILTELWTSGKTIVSKLTDDKDYIGLANYITKEGKKEYARKWTQSRNLERPTVIVHTLTKAPKEIKAPKEYKIIDKKTDYKEWTRDYQYIKAIRIGGRDYSDKWEAGALDAGGLPKASRKGSGKKNRADL